jgi:CheY-like chemotaxis protein
VPAPLWSDALQGSFLLALGLWLAPRVMRHHLADLPDPELATQAQQLTKRVRTLTQTRRDAVDTAAAELRRIERDLHDGAQARLVALGMSLQAAERLFPTSPEAALALVAEAKESSSRALTELRDLVRGIYPPALADRGLADAIRALALDAPLPVELDIDLPGPAATGGQASAPELLEALVEQRPDVGIVDVRLPPTHTDDGLRAALQARARVPGLPVLVLSQYVEQLAAVHHGKGGKQARGGHLRQAGPGPVGRRQPARPRGARVPGLLKGYPDPATVRLSASA